MPVHRPQVERRGNAATSAIGASFSIGTMKSRTRIPRAKSSARCSKLMPSRRSVEEATIGCTSGMLLCLDREQRLIYILGDIFGVTDLVGAELLEISRENFRQKLARARHDLHNFLHDKCGLVNEANPCRCAKKTQGFMKAGFVDPQNLLFAREHVTRVRDVAEKKCEDLDALDEAYAELHRDHPFQEPADFVTSLRTLINGTAFKSTLELE